MDRIDQDNQLLLNSLRDAHVACSDIYDFVNGSTPSEAIPVLIKVLPMLGNNAIKEGVIRALGDKAARGLAAGPLMHELRRLGREAPLLSWAIANSLTVVVRSDDFEDLRVLVHDPTFGEAREMLVLALARTKHPGVSSELLKLARDESLSGHVVIAAGELGARELRSFVEQQLSSSEPWVRKEAKRALRRFRHP